MVHPVAWKLESLILPRIAASELLSRQFFWRANKIHSYAQYVLAVVAGLGISPAVVQAFRNPAEAPAQGAPATPKFVEAVSPLPSWLVVITVVALVLWIVFRAYVDLERVEARATLAENLANQLSQIEVQLDQVLDRPDPKESLDKIYDNIISLVSAAIPSGAWPWRPLPPDDQTASRVKEKLTKLRQAHEQKWAAPLVDPNAPQLQQAAPRVP